MMYLCIICLFCSSLFQYYFHEDSGTFDHPSTLRAQWIKNLPAMQETQETCIQSLGWKDPLEKGMEPTPVLLPGESHGQRNLTGYSLWGHKELDTTDMTEYTHNK